MLTGSRTHCSSVRSALCSLGPGCRAESRASWRQVSAQWGRLPRRTLAGRLLGSRCPREPVWASGCRQSEVLWAPWCDTSQRRGGPELGCAGPPALAGPARCPQGSRTVGHRVRPAEQGPDPRGLRPQRPRVRQRPGHWGPFPPMPANTSCFLTF